MKIDHSAIDTETLEAMHKGFLVEMTVARRRLQTVEAELQQRGGQPERMDIEDPEAMESFLDHLFQER